MIETVTFLHAFMLWKVLFLKASANRSFSSSMTARTNLGAMFGIPFESTRFKDCLEFHAVGARAQTPGRANHLSAEK